MLLITAVPLIKLLVYENALLFHKNTVEVKLKLHQLWKKKNIYYFAISFCCQTQWPEIWQVPGSPGTHTNTSPALKPLQCTVFRYWFSCRSKTEFWSNLVLKKDTWVIFITIWRWSAWTDSESNLWRWRTAGTFNTAQRCIWSFYCLVTFHKTCFHLT